MKLYRPKTTNTFFFVFGIELAQMKLDELVKDVMNLDINKESMDNNCCLLKFFQYWYLAIGEFQVYYIFIELCYFIFVKICYFEFELKCMHFFWSVKKLFSRWMLNFCWTILFWMWVEDLKCMHCFLGCKQKWFLDGSYI